MPYYFTWLASLIIQRFKDVRPGSNWDKHFGGGYNKSSFMSFVVAMREMDSQTYWLLLVAPNGLGISLIIVILGLIKLIIW